MWLLEWRGEPGGLHFWGCRGGKRNEYALRVARCSANGSRRAVCRLLRSVDRRKTGRPIVVVYNPWGGENGPVTVAAFKAADSALRGSNGGFDSHTPPPHLVCLTEVAKKRGGKRRQ